MTSQKGCTARYKVAYATSADAGRAVHKLNQKYRNRLLHRKYECGDHWHVATKTTKYRQDKGAA